MKKKVKPIPDGYHSVTPYLSVRGASEAIDFYKKALTSGARLVRPIKDQFYGDRLGTVEDPFGHVWHLATHKEDLSMKELKKRAEKAASGE